MDIRYGRGGGWIGFSAIVLVIGGIFGVFDGLMAVYKSRFFSANGVYLFSGLHTWGWIVFGLGVAGILAGIYVLSGSQLARWTGVTIAALSALGQLLFAQAYPLWSLMIMTVDFLVIYGLTVYGGRESAAYAGRDAEIRRGESTLGDVTDQTRRAA
jgi:hypothetical protein